MDYMCVCMNECMSPSHVCLHNITCASAFLMRTYGREEQTWNYCVLCEDAISAPPPASHPLHLSGLSVRRVPPQYDAASAEASEYQLLSCSRALFGQVHYAVVCLCFPLIYCGWFTSNTSQSCLSFCRTCLPTAITFFRHLFHPSASLFCFHFLVATL